MVCYQSAFFTLKILIPLGSRAIVVVCRNEETAQKRFGVIGEGIGICTTRTGRRFFDNPKLETEFLERIRFAAEKSNFWDELETDWMILDGELMPWSVKAKEASKMAQTGGWR
jgi:protein phosphatase